MNKIITIAFILAATPVAAADYGYREPLQYRPVQSVPQNYIAASPNQNQTVVVNMPQPEVVLIEQPRRQQYWNPIGAIMAVPRAALAVPERVLGLDNEDY